MAMRVWVKDSNGNERVIKNTATTWAEVNEAINQFIRRCNINKINERKRIYGDQYNPAYDHLFVRYYTRTWQEDGKTIIDVGSHTEFFIWEGKYEGE